jgi:mono/diheme cytochrome c family protein
LDNTLLHMMSFGSPIVKQAVLILFLAAMGCSPDSPSSGRTVFMSSCASCHGVQGRGDGPLAAELEVKPADLTKIAARRDGLWPMVEVMSIIDGYHRRTIAREVMPIFGDLAEGDLVPFDAGDGRMTPTPVKLIALANYLETIQDPKATGTAP